MTLGLCHYKSDGLLHSVAACTSGENLRSLFGFLNIKMRKRHNSERNFRVVHMVEVVEAPVPLLSYKIDVYFYQESQLIVCPVGQKTWFDYGPCRTRLNMVPGQGDQGD